MAISKVMRQRLDNLVRIYLNAIEAHQAGWHDRNTTAVIEEYGGDLPGHVDRWKASDFVSIQADRLRNQHAKLPLAVFLLGKVRPCTCKGAKAACSECSGMGFNFTGGMLRPHHTLVLLARIFYNNDPSHLIADKLGITDRAFSTRLTAAREAASDELDKIDLLAQLLAADPQPGIVMA
jgi:hypothetical protein